MGRIHFLSPLSQLVLNELFLLRLSFPPRSMQAERLAFGDMGTPDHPTIFHDGLPPPHSSQGKWILFTRRGGGEEAERTAEEEEVFAESPNHGGLGLTLGPFSPQRKPL